MTEPREAVYNPVLEQFKIPITELRMDPANERKHGQRNLDSVIGSLSKYGQQTPIVYCPIKKTILKGNGTYTAAREMGWTHIIAIPTDIENALDKAGYRVADNRTGELAEWDMSALATTLEALKSEDYDIDFMFNEADMKYYVDDWDSDHEKVEGTKENSDGIIDVIKIVCPQGTRAKVKESIEKALERFKGVIIE